MKESRFYAAIAREEDGRYYAFVVPFSSSDNVISKLAYNGVLHANVYKNKEDAATIADFWNDCYRRNGTYLFDFRK